MPRKSVGSNWHHVLRRPILKHTERGNHSVDPLPRALIRDYLAVTSCIRFLMEVTGSYAGKFKILIVGGFHMTKGKDIVASHLPRASNPTVSNVTH